MVNETAAELRGLAEVTRQAAISRLPAGADERLLVFIEACRALDHRLVMQRLVRPDLRIPIPDLDLIHAGWNLVAAHCLSPSTMAGRFPLLPSTPDRNGFALGLLHQFGQSIFLRRLADMVEHGFVKAEPFEHGLSFCKVDKTASQFLDNIEFEHARAFSDYVKGSNLRSYGRWTICDKEEVDKLSHQVGAFLGHGDKFLESWKHRDIDSIMRPLVRPSPNDAGATIEYDADVEVDNHFLAAALQFLEECRDECGLHPRTCMSGTTGTDLTAIAGAVASFHLKHIRFVLLAMMEHGTIAPEQSLTIFSRRDTLISDLAEWLRMTEAEAEAAVDAVTLRASEASFLERHSLPQIPLLVSLENNVIMRPVSSVFRNPLAATCHLLASRDPASRDTLRAPRESWLRSDLYSQFMGSRYHRVDGNITLRDRGKIVTDVDASVFDRTSGDLALFQLKWQDFLTNDVRELRSRASNLVREIDEWAQKVTPWIHARPMDEIARAFRINPRTHGRIKSVWLFALSRTTARVQGYGFTVKHPNLAVGNWPHFVRVRRDVGPVPAVFPKMHAALMGDAVATVDAEPVPVEWTIGAKTIRLEDVWSMMPKAPARETPPA